jgi:hypothetical protein
MRSRSEERVIPRGDYQECLEHAWVLAQLLERCTDFLPKDCQLCHSSRVELMQFSGWINRKIDAEHNVLAARQQWRPK